MLIANFIKAELTEEDLVVSQPVYDKLNLGKICWTMENCPAKVPRFVQQFSIAGQI